jgi:hypothetical protein
LKQIFDAVGIPRKERARKRGVEPACELVEWSAVSIEKAEDFSGSAERSA